METIVMHWNGLKQKEYDRMPCVHLLQKMTSEKFTNQTLDSDGLCGDVDVCDFDPENDSDGDEICGDKNTCPYDSENDADGIKICGDQDSCPYDHENDANGDGKCWDTSEFAEVEQVDKSKTKSQRLDWQVLPDFTLS